MGYRSFARSMASAANAAHRESIRRQKAQLRMQERLLKKVEKIDDKKEKIVDALQDEYAKGKLSKEKYDELMQRKDEVTLELLVFGGQPAVSLAKRYITGKLDQREFDLMKEDVLPPEVLTEKKEMIQTFLHQANALEEFVKACDMKAADCCQHCSRKKSFFAFIRDIEGFKLCSRCRSEMSRLKQFTGLGGQFFELEAMTIEIDRLNKLNPHLIIKNECLL